MSITPIAPALPTPFADAAAGDASPAAGGFAALVAGLLAGTPAASVPPPAPAATGSGTTPDATVVDLTAPKGKPSGLAEAPAVTGKSTGDESIVAIEGDGDPGLVLTTGVVPGLLVAWQPPAAGTPAADDSATPTADDSATPAADDSVDGDTSADPALVAALVAATGVVPGLPVTVQLPTATAPDGASTTAASVGGVGPTVAAADPLPAPTASSGGPRTCRSPTSTPGPWSRSSRRPA